MKLYNTLTIKKEEFKPLKGNEVKIYTCGPTVYWFAHVGMLRSYVFADILKRVLMYNDYNVKQVINITDVSSDSAFAYFNVSPTKEKRHSALADALATAHLISRLVRLLEERNVTSR